MRRPLGVCMGRDGAPPRTIPCCHPWCHPPSWTLGAGEGRTWWLPLLCVQLSLLLPPPCPAMHYPTSVSSYWGYTAPYPATGGTPIENPCWKTVKRGKSPEADGMPVEFYAEFWDWVGPDIVEVFKEILERKEWWEESL